MTPGNTGQTSKKQIGAVNQRRDKLIAALEEGISVERVRGRLKRLDNRHAVLMKKLKGASGEVGNGLPDDFEAKLAKALSRLKKKVDVSPIPNEVADRFCSLVETVKIVPKPHVSRGLIVLVKPSRSGLVNLVIDTGAPSGG